MGQEMRRLGGEVCAERVNSQGAQERDMQGKD